jgi:hypothetical protein
MGTMNKVGFKLPPYGVSLIALVIAYLILGPLLLSADKGSSQGGRNKNCRSAETVVWAVRQCLAHQPACPLGGVDMYIQYKEAKDIMAANNCLSSGNDSLMYETN